MSNIYYNNKVKSSEKTKIASSVMNPTFEISYDRISRVSKLAYDSSRIGKHIRKDKSNLRHDKDYKRLSPVVSLINTEYNKIINDNQNSMEKYYSNKKKTIKSFDTDIKPRISKTSYCHKNSKSQLNCLPSPSRLDTHTESMLNEVINILQKKSTRNQVSNQRMHKIYTPNNSLVLPVKSSDDFNSMKHKESKKHPITKKINEPRVKSLRKLQSRSSSLNDIKSSRKIPISMTRTIEQLKDGQIRLAKSKDKKKNCEPKTIKISVCRPSLQTDSVSSINSRKDKIKDKSILLQSSLELREKVETKKSNTSEIKTNINNRHSSYNSKKKSVSSYESNKTIDKILESQSPLEKKNSLKVVNHPATQRIIQSFSNIELSDSRITNCEPKLKNKFAISYDHKVNNIAPSTKTRHASLQNSDKFSNFKTSSSSRCNQLTRQSTINIALIKPSSQNNSLDRTSLKSHTRLNSFTRNNSLDMSSSKSYTRVNSSSQNISLVKYTKLNNSIIKSRNYHLSNYLNNDSNIRKQEKKNKKNEETLYRTKDKLKNSSLVSRRSRIRRHYDVLETDICNKINSRRKTSDKPYKKQKENSEASNPHNDQLTLLLNIPRKAISFMEDSLDCNSTILDHNTELTFHNFNLKKAYSDDPKIYNLISKWQTKRYIANPLYYQRELKEYFDKGYSNKRVISN